MKRGKSKVPACAACGRRLRSWAWRGTSLADAAERAGYAPTADGMPRARGHDGNNLVCSMKCGNLLAMRLVLAEPAVLDFLPPDWRHRTAESVRSGTPTGDPPASALAARRAELSRQNSFLRLALESVEAIVHQIDRHDGEDRFRGYYDQVYARVDEARRELGLK